MREAAGEVTDVPRVNVNRTDRERAEMENQRLVGQLKERVKELRLLHEVATLLRQDPSDTVELLNRVTELLPAAFQRPRNTAARVAYGGSECSSPGFRKSVRRTERRFATTDGQAGVVEVVRTGAAIKGEEPFIQEELRLVKSVAEMLRVHFERGVAVERLSAASQEHERQHASLVALTRSRRWSLEGEASALREICETVARTIGVERVSVWRFRPDRSAILCQDLFITSTNTHTEGQALAAADYPAYFKAIETSELLVAEDAVRDGRTCEFTGTYLKPQGIGAMLDVPILVDGALDGVLCLEHVGSTRGWTHGEQGFALAAANLVALFLAHGARSRSEVRLASIFRASPTAIAINTIVEGRFLEVNDRYCELFGYTREELMNQTVTGLKLWADPEERVPVMRRLMAEGSLRGYETRFRHRSGELRDVILSLERIELPGEPEPVLIAQFTDITGRRRMEMALRESEERFQAFMDDSPVVAWMKDEAGRYVYGNAGLERLYGRPRDAVMGHLDIEFLPEAVARQLRENDLAVLEADCPLETMESVPSAAGEMREWQVSKFPFRDAAGSRFVGGMAMDITDRKRIEQQFLRAQRMESIGTLAGGIAHDLNNILAPILISLQLLEEEIRSEEGRSMLGTLQSCARRGADLVRQVLSFARGLEGERIEVNVGHLLREIRQVMRETLPRNIEVVHQPLPDLWPVTGDPTQLHQVFMNLCINARDAMAQGGRLTITTENREVDEVSSARNPGSRPGPHVVVTVADTGSGIAPAIRERIFEPFFTTKEVGKGTGLGLSTTLGILRGHNGFVSVESEPGKGSRFEVYLPARATLEVADPGAGGRAQPPRGNGETVLVVDDEEAVRLLTRKTLEHFGYRVLLAVHGADAIARYTRHRSEIAVVLTDMAMPVMDGLATIRALRAMNPAVRIIGSSGHADHEGVARAVAAGVQSFVPKPCTAETLLKAVKQVLSGPGG